MWCIGLIIFGVLTIKCCSQLEYGSAFVFGFLGLISMIDEVWLVTAIVLAIAFGVLRKIEDNPMFIFSILFFIGSITFGIVNYKVNPPLPNGIFSIGNPTVEEIRYDILGGNEKTMVNGSVSGHFFHGYGSVSGSISEDNFYKIYYPGTNADGEKIAIPKIVKEIETEVVLCPNDMESEYLLEIVTTQQYMERKYQEEQYFDDVSRRYKLYVRESTFNNKVVLDGNK